MGLRTKLHNAYMTVRNWVKGPDCCGLWENPDGRLVECDDWWGYQNCMFPGCGHYQIEHSDGSPNTVVYSKEHPEDVGTEVTWSKGCMNAGCGDCPGFWTKKDLHNFVHSLSYARNQATHMMFYDEDDVEAVRNVHDDNVKHVDASVRVIVQVTTTVKTRDCEALEKVFAREARIRDKFPNVLLDFDIIYEPEDEKTSITE